MGTKRSALEKYLNSIHGTGAVSEIALYKPFAQYILGELLGYPDNCLALNERQDDNVPDIKLYPWPRTRQHEGEVWAVAEGKLKDDDIRDPVRRQRVWEEQVRRYIRPETFQIILFAPETICVCNTRGELLAEVHLGPECLRSAVRGGAWESAALTEMALKPLLDGISFQAAQRGPQYEAFRRGDLPAGHIPLTPETLPLLQDVFQFGVRELRAIGERLFDALQERHQQVRPQLEELERQADIEIDDRRHGALKAKAWRLRRKNRLVLALFSEDYPEFCHDQSYAGTEERDFREIFVTNSVHVLLSRLFFVRLCEDLGLATRCISNAGIGYWRKLTADMGPLYQDLLQLACKYVAPIYERLFEEDLFDWFTGVNGELSEVLERILFRFNAFSFSKVDRDLLGTIYQSFRPRAERKRLGEYYTPTELVDFILAETGCADDQGLLQKRLLDPSCGSFTFGIRATRLLLHQATHLAPAQRLELIERAVVGYDINAFSTFLAHLSLLFSLLQDYLAAKRANPAYKLRGFSVQRLNTLTTGIEIADADNQRFDYVVGNPPFVRNERLPAGDRKEIESRYGELASGNTDLSAYFLFACAKWLLKEDGRLGMVAPIGLANAQSATELRLILAEYRLEALVSLEWLAKELFPDADIIPMLVFLRAGRSSPEGTIRLVHGLRSKAELSRAATDPRFRKEHTTVLPFARWRALSPSGDWPLEVTEADLPILEKLRKLPTWEQAQFATAKYAVKLSQSGQKAIRPAVPPRDRKPGEVPFIKGHNVSAFHISEEDEIVDLRRLGDAAGAGIWSKKWLAFFEANKGKSDLQGTGRRDLNAEDKSTHSPHPPSDVRCALVPKIYPRLTGSEADPLTCAANDSLIAVLPYQSSAGVITAILNSTVMSYYAFLTMRSAILLRRRSTWYPRTILNLPCPALSDVTKKKLHRLAADSAELSLKAEAGLDESAVFLTAMRQAKEREKLGFLGLAAPGATHEAVLDREDLGEVAHGASSLQVGGLSLVARDPDLLVLARAAFIASDADSLTIAQLQNLAVPADAAQRKKLARDLANVAENLEKLQGRMAANVAEIDELVAEALGLAPNELEIIRRRCTEFPLDVTVGRPRFVWSPDRKRQTRRSYSEEDRYKQ